MYFALLIQTFAELKIEKNCTIRTISNRKIYWNIPNRILYSIIGKRIEKTFETLPISSSQSQMSLVVVAKQTIPTKLLVYVNVANVRYSILCIYENIYFVLYVLVSELDSCSIFIIVLSFEIGLDFAPCKSFPT